MNCRILIVLLISLSYQQFASGQINALTQDGQKVVLYDDFTWQYAETGHHNFESKTGITKIEVGSDGLVRINLWIKNNRIDFFDGQVFTGDIQPIQLEYHQNTFFEKSVGKIKNVTFNGVSISFEYHQNTIFDKSLGKIKSISFGNESIDFEYHQIDFFKNSVGKVFQIKKGNSSINFEYHQNSIYPENDGRLKAISGNITGIKVWYKE